MNKLSPATLRDASWDRFLYQLGPSKWGDTAQQKTWSGDTPHNLLMWGGAIGMGTLHNIERTK